jgi:hypothetical protein
MDFIASESYLKTLYYIHMAYVPSDIDKPNPPSRAKRASFSSTRTAANFTDHFSALLGSV